MGAPTPRTAGVVRTMPTRTTAGNVSGARYEQIVAEDRQLVAAETKIQFKVR